MRRNLVVVFMLLAAVSMVLAQDKPNFSGTWAFDASKSDAMGGRQGGGGGGAAPQITLVITHAGNNLSITRKMMGPDGQERSSEMKYTTDGAENTNQVMGRGGQGNPQVSKSHWDGAALVTEYAQQTQNGEVQVKESRSVSADGKVLTVESVRGDRTTKQVFNKQ